MITRLVMAMLACLAPGPAFCAPWQTLSGQQSRIEEFRAVVVEDMEAWRELWLEHQGSLEGLPEVDFSKERIVGVFLGLRSSSGHSVRLDVRKNKDKNNKESVVSYELASPKGFSIPVFCAPFSLAKVPAGPVRVFASTGEPAASPSPKRRGVGKEIRETAGRVEALRERLAGGLSFD